MSVCFTFPASTEATMTYNRGGGAVRENAVRVSAQLHLILLLMQQSQTGGDVAGNQICVLQHQHKVNQWRRGLSPSRLPHGEASSQRRSR